MAGKAQEKRTDMESLMDSHQSKCSTRVMRICLGAMVILLIGASMFFIFYHYLLLQPINQTAQPEGSTTKVIITRELKDATKGQEVWTVEKGAKYLIFGCVHLLKASDKDATLKLTTERDYREIFPITKGKNGICCFKEKHLLASNMTIRLGSACKESFFLFQEQ